MQVLIVVGGGGGLCVIVGFRLEAKLVSSKPLIQVHLEILSRSV